VRIACLSAETADLCARLGAWEQVVAVSAYAEQSGLPRRPVVSGFSTGDVDRILAHGPDVVLAFSDVQADLCAALVRAGATVLATNQRTLAEIAGTMRAVGRFIGKGNEAEQLAAEFERELESLRTESVRRPRVYFEEWPEPPVTGIAWVAELIEWVGGCNVFAERRSRFAREREVTDAEIVAAKPEVILASWCGKPVDFAALQRRLGETPAVRAGRVHEIPGAEILQPGWRLLEGARRMQNIFNTVE
jgi:iron complex transport system substrate-binding protein